MKTTSKLAKIAGPLFDQLRLEEGDTHRISLVDQAKLIRAELADRFPSTKFSVRSRSYSGGCSITISWEDGPISSIISAIGDKYEGGGFDGMIDLAYSRSHWFAPDGSIAFAHTGGTAGSGGTVSEAFGDPHHPSAILVDFASDYVHTNRRHSLLAKRAALAKLSDCYGPVTRLDAVPFYTQRKTAYGEYNELTQDSLVEGEYLSTLVYRVLEHTLLAEELHEPRHS